MLAQWWAEPGSRVVIVGSGFPDLELACWQVELVPDMAGCGFWVSKSWCWPAGEWGQKLGQLVE